MEHDRYVASSDKLEELIAGDSAPSLIVLLEFRSAWRAAAEEEGVALRAWRDGFAGYDVFVAALDREEAAAKALAAYRARWP